jgi:hypothetical protein
VNEKKMQKRSDSMHGMTESARVQRINALCAESDSQTPPRPRQLPRYRHRATNRAAVLIAETDGVCTLQGIDGRSTYALRASLDNHEIWEKLP